MRIWRRERDAAEETEKDHEEVQKTLDDHEERLTEHARLIELLEKEVGIKRAPIPDVLQRLRDAS
jgi:hypothetical protein